MATGVTVSEERNLCDRPRVASDVKTRPTVVDLYAGAGGLSLGLEQAGFDVLAAVELDQVHALTHRFNFPRTQVLCTDVSRLSGDELLASASAGWAAHHPNEPFPGTVDAIVGGPPCQGFSVGGLRLPGDDRNRQLNGFVETVLALRPHVFCLENVAGLLESRFDALRVTALDRLRAAGYSIVGHDRVLNAATFGVPQNRRRVLIIGALDRSPVDVNSAAGQSTLVRDALDGLANAQSYRRLLRSDETPLNEIDRAARWHASSTYARRLAGLEVDPCDFSYPRIWDSGALTSSLRTVHARSTVARFARTAPGSVDSKSRLFRLPLEGVARTLRAGTGSDRGSHTSPRPIHPVHPRVVTVREAARLHGYPDWFRFHATNWHGHRQVGNSVPPPLARAAGEALMKTLGETPNRPTLRIGLGDSAWLRMSNRAAASARNDEYELAAGDRGLA